MSRNMREPVAEKPVITTYGSPQKVAEVVGGRASFDLTRPLSREDAGMRPGQGEVLYYRPERPFHVRVILPGDRKLAVDAVQLQFDGHSDPLFFTSYPGPAETAPPSSLQIVSRPPSLEDGRAHLMTIARQFGLDTGPIEGWYQAATKLRPGAKRTWAHLPALETSVGGVLLDVDAYHANAVDGEPDEPKTEVSLELFWQPK